MKSTMDDYPKILVGGPVRSKRGPLFDAWQHCIRNQKKVEIVSVEPLEDMADTSNAVGKVHHWDDRKIDRVARLRQRFLHMGNDVVHHGHEYVCMVDDDLLLAPDTLWKMIHELERLDADVAYGVFWTDWGSGPQPQVWEIQPYGWFHPHEVFTRLANGETLPVAGGGACTLFHRSLLDQRVRYHPRIASLPPDGSMWCGEDRTWALCCEVLELKQIAVGGVRIEHLYSDDQRTETYIQRALKRVGQDES